MSESGPPHDPWRAELPDPQPPPPPTPGQPPPAAPPTPPPDQADTGPLPSGSPTKELPPHRPRSHRGSLESPVIQRLVPPASALAVVVVVVLLLIWINGKSPGKGPGAGVIVPKVVHGIPTPAVSPSAAGTPNLMPTPVSTAPAVVASTPSVHASRGSAAGAAATAQAPVVVLNNSRIAGLAHQVAAELLARGWHVESIGNLQGRTPVTTVYYATGERAAAIHLAHEFPAISSIRSAASAEITSHADLTLVLTRYWS